MKRLWAADVDLIINPHLDNKNRNASTTHKPTTIKSVTGAVNESVKMRFTQLANHATLQQCQERIVNKVQETTGTLDVDPYFGPFALEVTPVHAGGLFDLLIMCTHHQRTLSLKTGLCSVSRAARVSAVAFLRPTLSCHLYPFRTGV